MLVVGGKAFGKVFAIEDATPIVFRVGQLLAWIERILHVRFFRDSRQEKRKLKGTSTRAMSGPRWTGESDGDGKGS
jgi:hypothetical protein